MWTSIDVKFATPGDAEAIGHIQVASWRAAYQDIVPESYLNSLTANDKIPHWQRILADPMTAASILIARGDGSPNPTGSQVLGFLSFGSADDQSEGDEGTTKEISRQAELRAIYIAPQHFSKGVGQCLWAAAQQKLTDANYSTVVVWVFAGNERAIRFYRSAGFTKSQAGETEIGGTTVTTLQLIKTLA